MSVLRRFMQGQEAAQQQSPLGGMAGMTPPIGGQTQDAMRLAASKLGLNERDQNAAIKDYLETGGVNLDPAVTAWCAAFVNATLKQSGVDGTGSNMARSFLDWGVGVDKPRQGDLAVFWRGDPNGEQGHVGFFAGYNPDGSIRVLGGNQSDSVSYANYSADQLLGFRRGPMGQYVGG